MERKTAEPRFSSDQYDALLEEREQLLEKICNLENRLKEKEDHLAHQQEHYKDLVEKAGIGILTDDEEGNIRYFNRRFTEMFGYTYDELKSKSILTIVHPDSLDTVKNYHRLRIEGKKAPSQYEFKGMCKNGNPLYLEVHAVELVENGEIIGTRSYLWDVTEHRLIEEALRKSESRYRILIEQAADGIFIMDLEGRCVDVNKNGCAMLGYRQKEILGLNFTDLIREEDSQCSRETFKQMTSGKNVVKEYLMKRKNGDLFFAEIASNLLPDGRLLAIVRDISVRKQMEEELLKGQKLESIGMLAGGIAHDFNNILTGVMGNISLAKMNLSPGTKALRNIQSAEAAANRAKDLVTQFITFSRGGKPIKKKQFIQDLVRDTVKFSLSGSRFTFRSKLPNDLPPIEIDSGQVRQVINNIVINAKEAMPEGGRLDVAAKSVDIQEKNGLPLQPGKWVRLSFKDRGLGIPGENLSKIFDPYFSTRERGKGMGLTAVYSIMKKHGGYIDVESEAGEGTTVHVYFPVAEEEKKEMPNSTNHESPSGFKGKILLMDDEEIIRDVAGEMLSLMGFEVEFAEHGDEAIEKYKEHLAANGRPYDVVIMDLTIPGGMGGAECIQKLHQLDPNVKALVSSGYSQDPVMSDFKKHGFSGVVDKPYKLNDLRESLERLMTNGG